MQKVMLIEDDRTMRSLLKTLLQIEGFVIIDTPVEDTDILYNTILHNVPDIIILDVFLHNGSGLDIVKKLKKEKKFKDIYILMSSGMELKEQCIEAGADGFILKPYMPDELLELLHSFKTKSN